MICMCTGMSMISFGQHLRSRFDCGTNGIDFSFSNYSGINVNNTFIQRPPRNIGRNIKNFGWFSFFVGGMHLDDECLAHGALSNSR